MTTKDLATKKLPVFDLRRCKLCGICSHFCPAKAIEVEADGLPFLANPEACTSCGLCEEMCPDWAVSLNLPDEEETGSGTA